MIDPLVAMLVMNLMHMLVSEERMPKLEVISGTVILVWIKRANSKAKDGGMRR